MNKSVVCGPWSVVSSLVLSALLFALCGSGHAQQSGKVYRVGRLSGGLSTTTFSVAALRRELRELGYVEGKNIVLELRWAEEKPDRLPALADELARLKLDVIIAGGPNDTLAAKKAIKTVPIVFTDSPADPIARGLVGSLARPGGNITGLSSLRPELSGKRLELLKEIVPKLSRVAVFASSRSRDYARVLSVKRDRACRRSLWSNSSIFEHSEVRGF